jgi:uncharacterized membrane protein YbhN (UPF0104 family)
VLLLAAVALFGVVFAVAVRAVPDAEVDVRWPLLAAAALVGVPLTMALNGAEYAATGAVVGHPVAWPAALRVSVLSSAANLLPVPGAVLVRARALNQLGTPYRRAFVATAVVGMAWVGTTAVVAGALVLASGDDAAVGGVLVAAGLAGIAAAHAAVVRRGKGVDVTLQIVVVELASVAVGGLRYWLVLEGLGFDPDAVQAVALTVSAVVASAVGVFPGGLGVREVVAAALAPLVGLPAAVGLVAVAVDRLLGLPVLAVAAGGFALTTPAGEAD